MTPGIKTVSLLRLIIYSGIKTHCVFHKNSYTVFSDTFQNVNGNNFSTGGAAGVLAGRCAAMKSPGAGAGGGGGGVATSR